MNTEILFVEDNPHKRARVVEFLKSAFQNISITEAHSFSAGCQAIDNKIFALVLLDISLPTYDRVGNESGGRFRPFAGKEIARKLIRNGAPSRIIFITQYAAFSDKGSSYSFESLKLSLAQECGMSFAGMIFYDSGRASWKNDLSSAIGNLDL